MYILHREPFGVSLRTPAVVILLYMVCKMTEMRIVKKIWKIGILYFRVYTWYVISAYDRLSYFHVFGYFVPKSDIRSYCCTHHFVILV